MQSDVERLVREGLPLADDVARRMYRKLGGALGLDELMAIARQSLVEAARDYDPQLAPFRPYLVMKVKWAMLDEARKKRRKKGPARRSAAVAALERLAEEAECQSSLEGMPAAESDYQRDLGQFLAQRAAAMAMGLVSLPDTDRHAEEVPTPEDAMAEHQLRREIKRAVERLPDRHRALVERHYFGGEAFDAIAVDLGISKSWASRLHAQSMDELAKALRGRLAAHAVAP